MRLHNVKDLAYRDAWRRRGEVLGIFANIARKFDRLMLALADRSVIVEPATDTLADLVIYAAKYLTWLAEMYPTEFDLASRGVLDAPTASANRGSASVAGVLSVLGSYEARVGISPLGDGVVGMERVCDDFGELELVLMDQAAGRSPVAPERKIELAWRLVSSASWLLAVQAVDWPNAVNAFRREVDRIAPE